MDPLFAFESWFNGNKPQVSAFYKGVEAADFIMGNKMSKSFAQLHVFSDRMTAEKAYAACQEQPDDEAIHYKDEREYDEDMDNMN